MEKARAGRARRARGAEGAQMGPQVRTLTDAGGGIVPSACVDDARLPHVVRDVGLLCGWG